MSFINFLVADFTLIDFEKFVPMALFVLTGVLEIDFI